MAEYFLYCDSISGESSLLNGKQSKLLACFDSSRRLISDSKTFIPLEKVGTLHSITITILDKNGKQVDLKGASHTFMFDITSEKDC